MLFSNAQKTCVLFNIYNSIYCGFSSCMICGYISDFSGDGMPAAGPVPIIGPGKISSPEILNYLIVNIIENKQN